MSENELQLKYGCNPHQQPARICSKNGSLPIEVLNGSPGYINLLDALNSWQLVRELTAALGLPAAASFKHVSPAGAAVALPLSDELCKSYFTESRELSPLATAYARARGADRMSSFGDWVALSEIVDESTAKLLKIEVSDGVIAPGFEPEALKILKKKKNGTFPLILVDPAFDPPALETREVFGIVFEQKRSNAKISRDMFKNIVTQNREIPPETLRDMVVAQIALKYTQSNSVCLALDGQVIGIGAGQQSRIHCTRLASGKADIWWLRQHPAALGLKFIKGTKRPDMNNGIDQFLRDDLTDPEETAWRKMFLEAPVRLSHEEKEKWMRGLHDVVLASDAFFPFRDNIDRASRSGVKYIVQPGGSIADQGIIDACDEYGMAMALTGIRLFHH